MLALRWPLLRQSEPVSLGRSPSGLETQMVSSLEVFIPDVLWLVRYIVSLGGARVNARMTIIKLRCNATQPNQPALSECAINGRAFRDIPSNPKRDAVTRLAFPCRQYISRKERTSSTETAFGKSKVGPSWATRRMTTLTSDSVKSERVFYR